MEQKLNDKLALKGLKLIKRLAPYTSKSCSTCGVLGKRNRHDFNCPNGHYHNSDFNAAKNLSQWDGFSCDLNLQRDASVMDSSGLNHGGAWHTPELGEYAQTRVHSIVLV